MNLIDLLTKRMVYHLTAVVPVISFLALQHRITIMLTFTLTAAHAKFHLLSASIEANGISGTEHM